MNFTIHKEIKGWICALNVVFFFCNLLSETRAKHRDFYFFFISHVPKRFGVIYLHLQ